MLILGVDPGTDAAGFAIIKKDGSKLTFLEGGLIPAKKLKDHHQKLITLRKEILNIINRWQPDQSAVEKIFFAKNQKTGINVAEARGVIVVTLAENKIPVLELAPNEIKSFLTGSGHANKKLIASTVALICSNVHLPLQDDITDAIALAIIAANINY